MGKRIPREEALRLLGSAELSRLDHKGRTVNFARVLRAKREALPGWSSLPAELREEVATLGRLGDASDPRYDPVLEVCLAGRYAGATNAYLLERLAEYGHSASEIEGKPALLEACPCCGYRTLFSLGRWEICRVCSWEDDGQDNETADEVASGPNFGLSLTRARINFLSEGLIDPSRKYLSALQEPAERYVQGRRFSFDGREVREAERNWCSELRREKCVEKYFAYGSNCSATVLRTKGVSFQARRRATLPGYRLLFNKRAARERLPEAIGFPNLNEAPGATVEGILYELDEEALPTLDASERIPDHYRRIRTVVKTDVGLEDCWTYEARPEMVEDGLVPSRNYLNHILAGREFLSEQYLAALNQSKIYSSECACCHRTSEVLFIKEGDRLETLCQPCREARLTWSDAHGCRLTLAETERVMRLVMDGSGFSSVRDLIKEAVARQLIRRG